MSSNVLLHIILAVFLPPVSVYITSGCGSQLCLNLLLCLFLFFPHIHAIYLFIIQYKNEEMIDFRNMSDGRTRYNPNATEHRGQNNINGPNILAYTVVDTNTQDRGDDRPDTASK
ncbi:hypothetical protein NEAUS04_1514 [Nematocida ausubeli]|nr:hypothetical protein NEAUS07_0630 [Nematocida ausubeli]KAI5146971.1 hypothetical protein NEAUS05_0307 [Nematocida ausubeli]KAI5163379.1 hypothetical protein NEAUS04_1514 [Nematocida ausubeli]